MKPVAKKTKSGKGAPKKATKKKVVAKKSSPSHRQAERVKSTQRVALVALPRHRPRTDKGSPQADEAKQAANDADETAAIDSARLINRLACTEQQLDPPQTDEETPPALAERVADDVVAQEDRLEEIEPELAKEDEEEWLRLAIWWAEGLRLPRAAFVGRALHELKSIDEELAPIRGTAYKICQRIQQENPKQLRTAITDVMNRLFKEQMSSEDAGSALVGCLNKAWAVLEALGMLKAAPGSGVYLIGRGLKFFDGFPDWNKPDEPLPKKPTRPPRKPRT